MKSNLQGVKKLGSRAEIVGSIAQLIAVHQGDFDTALDYLQQSEAILRHIGSPMADQVVEIIQQLQDIRADRSP